MQPQREHGPWHGHGRDHESGHGHDPGDGQDYAPTGGVAYQYTPDTGRLSLRRRLSYGPKRYGRRFWPCSGSVQGVLHRGPAMGPSKSLGAIHGVALMGEHH